jgi:Protein of unknown function (DUF2637)
MRRAALVAIGVLVAAASLVSFAESYRALLDWASHHGLNGVWALAWPLQVDTFIAVGELALFVALADSWSFRSRVAAWSVTGLGLAVSVAGNIGHAAAHDWASRATAAVPPLAAAAALAVGLGVLKRVVAARTEPAAGHQLALAQIAPAVPASAREAAEVAYAASVRGGDPLSGRALERRFGISRAEAAKVRQAVAAASNGHVPQPAAESVSSEGR